MEKTEETKKVQTEEKREPYYSRKPRIGAGGPSWIRQQFSQGMTYFLVIAACVLFYFGLSKLEVLTNILMKIVDILKPVLYGLVIAYLLNPLVKKIEYYCIPIAEKVVEPKLAKKLGRIVGVFTSLILLIALVVALCNMMIPELYASIRDLIYTLPGQISDLVNQFSNIRFHDATPTSRILQNILEQGSQSLQTWLRRDLLGEINTLMSNLTFGMINVFSELFNVLIGLIVSVYVMFGREHFSALSKKMVYAFFNTDRANLILHMTRKTHQIFGGFIIGKLIDSAIIGVLCFIGVSILNMPYALLVSVIVGVTNVIPFFGPYIGAVPSTILILLEDPKKGIYFVLFILFLQQLDGNIIGPKILGNSTGLSAFWVVVAILFGGGMFGFVGMIMGVPTFAVIYYIVMLTVNHKLEKKNLPLQTLHYGEDSYVDENGNFIKDDIE